MVKQDIPDLSYHFFKSLVIIRFRQEPKDKSLRKYFILHGLPPQSFQISVCQMSLQKTLRYVTFILASPLY